LTSPNEHRERKCVSLRDYNKFFEPNLVHSSTSTIVIIIIQKHEFYLPQKSKMVADAILNFEKCQYIRILLRHICTKLGEKIYYGHTQMTTWPKT